MDTQEKDTSVFHQLSGASGPFLTGKVLVLFLVVLIAGIGGGYLLSQHTSAVSSVSGTTAQSVGSSVEKGVIYGSTDTTTFKDTATGTMQQGGIDGEGQFHLVRPGGDSQNVYMTSSIVDLSKFVGHKVQVWGQTQAAQHAGWLMDVGRVEVVE